MRASAMGLLLVLLAGCRTTGRDEPHEVIDLPLDASFTEWCEAARSDETLRPVVKLVLWEAGMRYWARHDCEGAAPIVSTLDKLDLRGAKLEDIRPIASLTALRVLDLSRNDIADVRPLSRLKELEALDLQRNHVARIAPLAALPKLKVLYLWKNPVQDKAEVSRLRELRTEEPFAWHVNLAAAVQDLTAEAALQLLLSAH